MPKPLMAVLLGAGTDVRTLDTRKIAALPPLTRALLGAGTEKAAARRESAQNRYISDKTLLDFLGEYRAKRKTGRKNPSGTG